MKIVVDGAGFKELNQEYLATSPDEIPTGLSGNYDFWEFAKISLFQVLSGFVARRVGTPRTHGRNSTEIQSGSKRQLKWVGV